MRFAVFIGNDLRVEICRVFEILARGNYAEALRTFERARNTFAGLEMPFKLATIDLIENGFMQNAAEVGAYAMDALEEIQARHPSIGQVRGKGLMIGVEFVKDRETKEPDHDLTERVVDLGYERGLLMLSCGKSVIRIAPPLSMSKSEMDEGLRLFEDALTAAEKEVK